MNAPANPCDPARVATDALRAAPVEVHAPTAEVRSSAIDALGDAIVARARTRRRRATATRLGLAAAIVIATLGGLRLYRSRTQHAMVAETAYARAEGDARDVSVVHRGTTAPLGSSTRIDVGDRILAASAAHATIALPSGTRAGIEANARL